MEYSKPPKTGRPDFGAFHLCPVCESSGFQTTSRNRTILPGYRTSGCFQSQFLMSDNWTFMSGYRTFEMLETSGNRLSGWKPDVR